MGAGRSGRRVDPGYETTYHETEGSHWWPTGRRDFIVNLVQRLDVPPGATILEVGCSAGLLLAELRGRGYRKVTGVDLSMDGARRCQGRGLTSIAVMDAGRLGFAPASFDLVIASDVLEHIYDDTGALEEWRRVLKPSGRLLVLVPAFQILWADHDTVNRHHRRYTTAQLRRRLAAADLRVERAGYWNCALFLPILAVRITRRLLRRAGRGSAGDLRPVPKLANRGLCTLLRAENRWLLRSLPFPVGVSAFAIARR